MPDSMEELRRQLDEQKVKRSSAVERLKAAAQRATEGRSTPITDKHKLPAPDEMSESSESSDDLTPTQRLARRRQQVEEAHEACKGELLRLKQTTMRAAARQTTLLDPVRLRIGLNGGSETDEPVPSNGTDKLRPAASDPFL